ncbi:MAG: hypothetical protein KA224_03560 [Steroidobacteraceae bacterium]|nr:hypothetical protein [Steroidobacteraceae bacterium]
MAHTKPDPAKSDWMAVMLGEVSRKQQEAAQGQAEEQLRRQESAASGKAAQASGRAKSGARAKRR